MRAVIRSSAPLISRRTMFCKVAARLGTAAICFLPAPGKAATAGQNPLREFCFPCLSEPGAGSDALFFPRSSGIPSGRPGSLARV